MICFQIKRNGKYLQINAETFDLKIDVGLFDEAEAEAQMNELENAIEEIKSYIKPNN